MSFDVDEDILQDFLVEAGEILEQLQEQLVDLENNPEDADLLNAIFRGYHTVKGGAGFLSLTELVEICHGAENVFDVMRNGQRTLTPELMDIILQATDVVVEMFERVKARDPLEPADAHLVDLLHKLSRPETPDENIFGASEESATAPESVAAEPELVIEEPTAQVPSGTSDGGIDEITEDEFEALLDELHGSNAPGQSSSASKPSVAPASPSAPTTPTAGGDSDDITDEEFEALLDDLHGKGQFATSAAPASEPKAPVAPAPSNSSSDEEITDDEFEALLDQLHGSGQGPTQQSAAPISPEPPVDKAATEAVQKAKQAAPVKAAPTSNSAAPSKAGSTAKPKAASPAPKKDDKKAAAAAPPAETTVRVDTKRLDQIMNMVGELVLVRNRLISFCLL